MAGVDEERVIVVGRQSVHALGLKDGKLVWPDTRLQLPNGQTPGGMGVIAGNCFYLPLKNGEILAIANDSGKIVEQLRGGAAKSPGTLLVTDHALLWHGPRQLWRWVSSSTN